MERVCRYRFTSDGRIDLAGTVRPKPVIPLPICHWTLKWVNEHHGGEDLSEVYVFWDDAVPEHVVVVIYEGHRAKLCHVEIPEKVLRQAKY